MCIWYIVVSKRNVMPLFTGAPVPLKIPQSNLQVILGHLVLAWSPLILMSYHSNSTYEAMYRAYYSEYTKSEIVPMPPLDTEWLGWNEKHTVCILNKMMSQNLLSGIWIYFKDIHFLVSSVKMDKRFYVRKIGKCGALDLSKWFYCHFKDAPNNMFFLSIHVWLVTL